MTQIPGSSEPSPSYRAGWVVVASVAAAIAVVGALVGGAIALLALRDPVKSSEPAAPTVVVTETASGSLPATNHAVPEAENVVMQTLVSDNASEVLPLLASGVGPTTVTDQLCGSFLADKSWSHFKITRSVEESNGAANVTVDVTGRHTNINFRLLNQNGWKIQRFTCDG